MNNSEVKQTNNSDKEQINDYISPDRNEVIRYLGYRGITEPDEKLNAMIDECIKEMQAKFSPRSVYKTFPINWENVEQNSYSSDTFDDNSESAEYPEYNKNPNTEDKIPERTCEFAGIRVSSGNLLKNLKGCSKIVLLAVTLGPAPDMLVRRSEIRDIMKAYTYQAVGAAMVEAWCNEINDRIIEEARAAVASAIDFYNNERPHMSLDWMTPAEAALCSGELKKKWVSYRENHIKNDVA